MVPGVREDATSGTATPGLSVRDKHTEAAAAKFRQLRERHARKAAFIQRLDKSGLPR
jgi:hypothetical protein